MQTLSDNLGNVNDQIISSESGDVFTLNDIVLRVPPTDIDIRMEDLAWQWRTLRTKSSTKVASGHGQSSVHVTLVFRNHMMMDLHRLIVQYRSSPFAFIENRFIRETLAPTWEIDQNMGFTMTNLVVTPMQGSSDTWVVSLDLLWFNYFPFTQNLLYKLDWRTNWINSSDSLTVDNMYKYSIGWELDRNYNKVSRPSVVDETKTDGSRDPSRYTWNQQLRRYNSLRKKTIGEMQRVHDGEVFDLLPLPSNMEPSPPALSPSDSRVYVRYCNYLQRDALIKNFGFNIEEALGEYATFFFGVGKDTEDRTVTYALNSGIADPNLKKARRVWSSAVSRAMNAMLKHNGSIIFHYNEYTQLELGQTSKQAIRKRLHQRKYRDRVNELSQGLRVDDWYNKNKSSLTRVGYADFSGKHIPCDVKKVDTPFIHDGSYANNYNPDYKKATIAEFLDAVVVPKGGNPVHWRESTNSFHQGMDVAVPVGTPCYAVEDGRIQVVKNGFNSSTNDWTGWVGYNPIMGAKIRIKNEPTDGGIVKRWRETLGHHWGKTNNVLNPNPELVAADLLQKKGPDDYHAEVGVFFLDPTSEWMFYIDYTRSGNYLRIEHDGNNPGGDSHYSKYMHLQEIAINPKTNQPYKVGDSVRKGDIVAYTGSTAEIGSDYKKQRQSFFDWVATRNFNTTKRTALEATLIEYPSLIDARKTIDALNEGIDLLADEPRSAFGAPHLHFEYWEAKTQYREDLKTEADFKGSTTREFVDKDKTRFCTDVYHSYRAAIDKSLPYIQSIKDSKADVIENIVQSEEYRNDVGAEEQEKVLQQLLTLQSLGWFYYGEDAGAINMYYKTKTLAVANKNMRAVQSGYIADDVVLTSIMGSVQHIVSSIPVLGHEFPTQQHLGSIEPKYSVEFTMNDNVDIDALTGMPRKGKSLMDMRATLQRNSRAYRSIIDGHCTATDTFITRLLGTYLDDDYVVLSNGREYKMPNAEMLNSDDVNVEGIDLRKRSIVSRSSVGTVPGNPGLSVATFELCETNPYISEEILSHAPSRKKVDADRGTLLRALQNLSLENVDRPRFLAALFFSAANGDGDVRNVRGIETFNAVDDLYVGTERDETGTDVAKSLMIRDPFGFYQTLLANLGVETTKRLVGKDYGVENPSLTGGVNTFYDQGIGNALTSIDLDNFNIQTRYDVPIGTETPYGNDFFGPQEPGYQEYRDSTALFVNRSSVYNGGFNITLNDSLLDDPNQETSQNIDMLQRVADYYVALQTIIEQAEASLAEHDDVIESGDVTPNYPHSEGYVEPRKRTYQKEEVEEPEPYMNPALSLAKVRDELYQLNINPSMWLCYTSYLKEYLKANSLRGINSVIAASTPIYDDYETKVNFMINEVPNWLKFKTSHQLKPVHSFRIFNAARVESFARVNTGQFDNSWSGAVSNGSRVVFNAGMEALSVPSNLIGNTLDHSVQNIGNFGFGPAFFDNAAQVFRNNLNTSKINFSSTYIKNMPFGSERMRSFGRQWGWNWMFGDLAGEYAATQLQDSSAPAFEYPEQSINAHLKNMGGWSYTLTAHRLYYAPNSIFQVESAGLVDPAYDNKPKSPHVWWTSRSHELEKLSYFRAALDELANEMLGDYEVLEFFGLSSLSPSIYTPKMMGECYPDLDLPIHPFYGSANQVSPDFYFWNIYDDGRAMNDDRYDEMVKSAHFVVENAFQAMEELESGRSVREKRPAENIEVSDSPESDIRTVKTNAEGTNGSNSDFGATSTIFYPTENNADDEDRFRDYLKGKVSEKSSMVDKAIDAMQASGNVVASAAASAYKAGKFGDGHLELRNAMYGGKNGDSAHNYVPDGVALSNSDGIYGNNAGVMYSPRVTGAEYDRLRDQVDKVRGNHQMFGSRQGYLEQGLDSADIKDAAYRAQGEKYSAPDQFAHGFDQNSLKKLAEDSAKDILSRKKTLARAFPTFRLMIVEEDEFEDRTINFDDFYSYNAVKEFSVVQNRKLPADHAVIVVQNVSGSMDGTRKGAVVDLDYFDKSLDSKSTSVGNVRDEPGAIGTDSDQPFDAVVLRPGLNIQLRCGYSNDPNNLTVLISGRVVDVSWNSAGDLAELLVQSFGTELVQSIKSAAGANDGKIFHTTHELLSTIMMSPELAHFGRWEFGQLKQYGESKDARFDFYDYSKDTFGGRWGITSSVFGFMQEHPYVTVGGLAALTALDFLPVGKIGKVAKAIPGGRFVKTAFKGLDAPWRAGAYVAGKAKGLADGVGATGIASQIGRRIAGEQGISALRTIGSTLGFNNQLRKSARALGRLRVDDEDIKALVERTLKNGNLSDADAALLTQLDNQLDELVRMGAVEFTDEGADALARTFFGETTRRQLDRNLAETLNSLGTEGGDTAEKIAKAIINGQENILIAARRRFYGGQVSRVTTDITVGEWTGMRMTKTGMYSLWRIFEEGLVNTAVIPRLLAATATADLALMVLDYAGLSYSKQVKKFFDGIQAHLFLSPADDNLFCPHPKDYMDLDYSFTQSAVELVSLIGLSALTYDADDVAAQVGEFARGATENGLSLSGGVERLIINKKASPLAFQYQMNNQTIWSTFHEMSLRHPGWIYGTRPYGTRFRYTMFFGVPSQRYWAKPAGNRFIRRMNDLYRLLESKRAFSGETSLDSTTLTEKEYVQNFGRIAPDGTDLEDWKIKTLDAFRRSPSILTVTDRDDNGNPILGQSVDLDPTDFGSSVTEDLYLNPPVSETETISYNSEETNLLTSEERNYLEMQYFGTAIKEYLYGLEIRFRPFRRYHTFSSFSDIVYNGLIASENATINAVDVAYFPVSDDPNEASKGTYLFKAHSRIPDHRLRVAPIRYRMCKGYTMAMRYGMGELLHRMRDMYRGEIVLVGNPRIRPWDIGIVMDSYNDMTGPVEVEQVVHNFSHETGYITEIKPSAVVFGNEISSYPVLEAMKVFALAMHDIEESSQTSFGLPNSLITAPVDIAHDAASFVDDYTPNLDDYFEKRYRQIFGVAPADIAEFAGGINTNAIGNYRAVNAVQNTLATTEFLVTEAAKQVLSPPIPALSNLVYESATKHIRKSPDSFAYLIGAPILFLSCLKEDVITVVPLMKGGTPIVSGVNISDPTIIASTFLGKLKDFVDDKIDGYFDEVQMWREFGSQVWKHLPEIEAGVGDVDDPYIGTGRFRITADLNERGE